MNPKLLDSIRRRRRLLLHFLPSTLVVIFAAEIGVMRLLPLLVPAGETGWDVALLDAAILSIVSAPLLWWFCVRPLRTLAVGTSEEYGLVLESAADAIVVIDQNGIVETFNPAAERMFQFPAAEVVGQNVACLMPDPYRREHDQYLRRYYDTGIKNIIGFRRKVVGRRKDGTEFPLELHVSETRFGRQRVFIGIARDITERRRVQQELQNAAEELANKNTELEILAAELAELNTELDHTARCDVLTGLWNRRAWHESAKLEHQRCVRHHTPYAAVMIDVDHFKRYNDTLGHPAGDECLRRVAQCLASALRVTDLLGRYGGEEFAMLLPETDREGAINLAERIREAIWNLNLSHSASPTADRVTISLGVAACQGAATLDDVIQTADKALYAAKKAGRNRVCDDSQLPVAPANA
ncbi:MAG: diguanylate cyclase [Planctomycetota bacterium]